MERFNLNYKNSTAPTFCFVLCFVVLTNFQAHSSEFFEKFYTMESKQTNQTTARKEMIDSANVEASEEVIMSIIGAEKLERYKSKIQSQVLRASDKYILYSKAGTIRKIDTGFSMDIQLKISLTELKTILQNVGLLNSLEGYRTILPIFTVSSDEDSSQFGWWYSQDNNSAKNYYSQLVHVLNTSFIKNEIYSIETSTFDMQKQIPNVLKSSYVSAEDRDFLARYFQVPLVLEGQVTVNKLDFKNMNYEVKLSVIQVDDGKVVADIKRKISGPLGKQNEYFNEIMNDLSQQVKDGWQKGVIGTDLVKLSFKGFYNPKRKEELIQKLKSEVIIIRNLKERLISTSEVVLEANTTSSPDEIVKKVTSISMNGKKMQLVQSYKNELTFQ